MKNFQLLISKETLNKIIQYKIDIEEGREEPGNFFKDELSKNGQSVDTLDLDDFVQLLIQSKKPRLFAESESTHDHDSWTVIEESILGDISVNVPVTMYNDGGHGSSYINHDEPIQGYLAYVPGALLGTGSGPTADMKELIVNGTLNLEKLTALYERRLLPQLIYANQLAANQDKKAVITVPGIGTGMFAGAFYDVIKSYFREALISVLEKNYQLLPMIDIVHYDPYAGDEPSDKKIGPIDLRVRPSSIVESPTGQLAYPSGSASSTHILVSMVAWDHFSWPGNDFWGGARQTDDGVKAASTDTMKQVTGFDGVYDSHAGRYLPPESFTHGRKMNKDWEDYAKEKLIEFNGPVNVLLEDGKLYSLGEAAKRIFSEGYEKEEELTVTPEGYEQEKEHTLSLEGQEREEEHTLSLEGQEKEKEHTLMSGVYNFFARRFGMKSDESPQEKKDGPSNKGL